MLSAVIPDDLSPLSGGAITPEEVTSLLPAPAPAVHDVNGKQDDECCETENNTSATLSATLVTALASALRLNVGSALVASDAPALEPVSLRDAKSARVNEVAPLVWFVDGAVGHPMRTFVGGLPFFLLTAEPPGFARGSVIKVGLERMHSLTVGSVNPNTTLRGLPFQAETACSVENVAFASLSSIQQLNPLAADDARYYLSMIFFDIDLHATSEIKKYPVFAYCQDMTGKRKYLGIEAQWHGYPSSVYEFITFDIRDSGAVLSKSLDDDEALPDVDDEDLPGPLPMMKDLLAESEDIVDVGAAIRTYAEYEVLRGNSYALSRARPSSITMTVCCDGAREVLSAPPVSSVVSLKIRCVSGLHDKESHPTTSQLCAELSKLRSLALAMIESRPWEGDPNDSTREVTEQEIDKFLDGMAEEKAGPGPTARTDDTAKNRSTARSDLDPLQPRKDLDFTDRLWVFCQAARNQEDLVRILAAAAEDLESGRLRPMVRKTNQSSFANLVRECLRLSLLQTAPDYAEQQESVSRAFDFWTEQPLECLVELGISKLKRDYLHYLVGNNLASWSQLEPFVDPTVPLLEQVTLLSYLQRAVEVWSLVRTNLLAVPAETLRLMVQAVLERFRGFFSARQVGEEHLATDTSDVTCRLHESLMLNVYFPLYSASTDTLLGSVAASFEPSLWEMVVYDSSAAAASSARGKDLANGGCAFFVQFDRNERLFPKTFPELDNEAVAAEDGDGLRVFESVHQLSASTYRMVRGIRVI